MKKLILASMLATLCITAFSIESSAQKWLADVSVKQTFTLGPNCAVTIRVIISVYWDGPGTKPKAVIKSDAVAEVNCPGGFYAKQSPVTKVELEDQEAHMIELKFEKTGDLEIDKLLDDPNFYPTLMANFNAQIDQKKP
jgi:hypothetical protein